MSASDRRTHSVERLEKALPPFVRGVLERLGRAGHKAFVVGGAVRDAWLGRGIQDWDVATDAGAERIQELFSHVRSFRLSHETVTLVFNGVLYEVTPFRGGRKAPGTLEEDLSHRDFTLDAMAYDPWLRIVLDPHQGGKDMAARIIRAVGRPEDRFREDPLRMLRAARLAATLAFRIEPESLRAMKTLADGIAGVAVERVRDELTKLLLADRPSAGLRILHRSGLMERILPELVEGHLKRQNEYHRHTILKHVMETVDRVESTTILRWTALLHDVAKPRLRTKVEGRWRFTGHEEAGAELAGLILKRLRMDHALIDRVTHLIRHHVIGYGPEWSDAAVRRLIRRVGRSHIRELLAFRKADIRAHGQPDSQGGLLDELERRVEEAMSQPLVTRIRDLALNGRDVMEIAGLQPGPEVGRILEMLCDRAAAEPSLNTRKGLAALVQAESKRTTPPGGTAVHERE